MPLPDELLARLRCPESGQTLSLADNEMLEKFRSASEARFEAALLREDGKRAYPIRDGLPILLLGEAISIS